LARHAAEPLVPEERPVPTTIAIESKPVILFGITTPYEHLYLVKTVTDNAGKVLDERVIRGNVAPDGNLETQVNIPLAQSEDARGSATPAQRHHTVLNLDGRDADAVWNIMAQHAANIHITKLRYGVEAFGFIDYGGEVNSNTVVASALHSVGINLAQNLPAGIGPGDVPLYNRIDAVLVDDVIMGAAQSDIIFGGVGSDSLNGAGGNDQLYGEIGADTLLGGAGNDRLDGGTGADLMNGGAGSDIYHIDQAGDRIVETSTSASSGVDLVNSTLNLSLYGKADLAGMERLVLRGPTALIGVGNDQDNWIYGNAEANVLVGRTGKDVLRGKEGNDHIRGGAGGDLLEGGAGKDTFEYRSLADSRAGSGIDKILDFQAVDVLDLSTIDANTLVAGNQSFTFIGSAAFSGAGQLRFGLDGAGNTIVQADVNGDLTADFEVLLRGYTRTVNGGDFIL